MIPQNDLNRSRTRRPPLHAPAPPCSTETAAGAARTAHLHVIRAQRVDDDQHDVLPPGARDMLRHEACKRRRSATAWLAVGSNAKPFGLKKLTNSSASRTGCLAERRHHRGREDRDGERDPADAAAAPSHGEPAVERSVARSLTDDCRPSSSDDPTADTAMVSASVPLERTVPPIGNGFCPTDGLTEGRDQMTGDVRPQDKADDIQGVEII